MKNAYNVLTLFCISRAKNFSRRSEIPTPTCNLPKYVSVYNNNIVKFKIMLYKLSYKILDRRRNIFARLSRKMARPSDSRASEQAVETYAHTHTHPRERVIQYTHV